MLLRRIVQRNSPTLLSSPSTRPLVGSTRRAGLTGAVHGLPHQRRWNAQATAVNASADTNINATQSGEGQRNPNEGILDMLRLELQEEEKKLQPYVFRMNAFAKAIDTISRIGETIKSGDDYVLEVQGIGIGIKNRINQYFVQHDLEAAYNEEQRNDALRRAAVIDLQKVPGIGQSTRRSRVSGPARCSVASDKYHSMLTPQQIICLKYIKHLDKTTTRADAERILAEVKSRLPSQYEAVLVGEYRRGASAISSLDIMLLHPDFVHVPMPTEPPAFPTSSDPPPPEPTFEPFWDSVNTSSDPSSSTPSSSNSAPPSSSSSSSSSDSATTTPKRKSKRVIKKSERTRDLTKAARKASLLHNEVIPCLRNADVMCETIGETVNTWTGVVRVPPSPDEGQEPLTTDEEEEPRVALSLQTPVGVEYRRVTFQMVPQMSRPTALLALTGDDELNKHMRRKAEREGMLLNEHGLWRWNPATTPEDSPSSPPPETASDGDEATPQGFWGIVPTPTEADVFKELGMKYIPPEKRNWGFVSGNMRPTKKKFSTSFVGS
ncbi:hypothetical protein NMY22_g6238 [Coprinellus aureogranulatus]|nr:hypothetical protein NMY22_g6238 [Coprinellus aureogranulatus]